MARFVHVTVGCDWPDCDVTAPEGDESIVTKTVAVDGKQTREFLLCEPKHREAFEDVVLPLMQAGIAVPEPKKTGRSKKAGSPSASGETQPSVDDEGVAIYDCQVEGCGRQIKKRTGMAQHVGPRGHGFESLAAYEAQYGALATT